MRIARQESNSLGQADSESDPEMSDSLLPPAADHPERRALTDELHARPFAPLTAPAQIAYIAIATDGASRAEGDSHLQELLLQLGMEPLTEVAGNHGAWAREDFHLRWERHTEFISYTLTVEALPEIPFDPSAVSKFPAPWLEAAPGGVITAVLMQVELASDLEAAESCLMDRFMPHLYAESVAAAWLAEKQALAVSDFHIDANGFTRFGLIGVEGVGPRRLGRLTQRMVELETYRTLAMRALPTARRIGPELRDIGREIASLVDGIGRSDSDGRMDPKTERAMLQSVTEVSAKLERLSADSAYRFSASRAYRAIVDERLEVIRQQRVLGRQTFSEFMIRRFYPAMRTCISTEDRLASLAVRAERAANLLRTRVDVTLEAQNQALLASMNRRAELQLRLQQTVEGLSVVAISYYAVSLAGYILAPFGKWFELPPKLISAAVAVPIIAIVWLMVRRLRREAEK